MNSAAHMPLSCTMMMEQKSPHVQIQSFNLDFLNFLIIQAEKISKAIKLSGNEVEQYWPTLFAKALKNTNIGDLLTNVASAGPATGVAAGPVAGAGAAAVEEKKEEKKEEAEDVDMGNLFGGDDDY